MRYHPTKYLVIVVVSMVYGLISQQWNYTPIIVINILLSGNKNCISRYEKNKNKNKKINKILMMTINRVRVGRRVYI